MLFKPRWMLKSPMHCSACAERFMRQGGPAADALEAGLLGGLAGPGQRQLASRPSNMHRQNVLKLELDLWIRPVQHRGVEL